MRVIAGEARGRKLSVPPGLQVRPSGARLRESAFGILEHRGAIVEANVLDLFAGSGSLGIEALSRGASRVVAVEQDRRVAECLIANADRCGFAARHRTLVRPVLGALGSFGPDAVFDLIFLDPPYGKVDIDAILGKIAAGSLLCADGVIMVEHPHAEGPDAGGDLEVDLRRRFGGSEITILRQRVG
jgi:16S rRNA (guanine(966)-N(2))-methyltransferase RsmD